MRSLVLLISVLTCLTAQPVLACIAPLPRTPEEEARVQLDWQTRIMDSASTIFLARIVAADRIPPGPSLALGGRRVTMEPIRSLRGDLPRRSFTLQHESGTTCGPYPSWAPLSGDVGEVYVVFATSARVSQDYVIYALSPDEIVIPTLRDLLDL